MIFNKRTLVTITAPTCAGKSFLLDALPHQYFNRIVSATDRRARPKEVHGFDYNFLSPREFNTAEELDQFIELVTYNGTRYGVTKAEMFSKLQQDKTPVVILEPHGLEVFRKYCKEYGIQLFSIFVNAPENIRIARLSARTSNAILCVSDSFSDEHKKQQIEYIISDNNKRMQAILGVERNWITSPEEHYSVIVDGTTSVDKIIGTISDAVNYTNRKI